MGELHSLTTFPSTETNSIPSTGLHTHKHTDLQLVDTNLKVFKVSLGEGQFLPLEAITLSPAIVRERGGVCVCMSVSAHVRTRTCGECLQMVIYRNELLDSSFQKLPFKEMSFICFLSRKSHLVALICSFCLKLIFSFLFLFIEIHI